MTKRKGGVAFLIIDIPDLSGSGGAERFFADFFDIYNDQNDPERKLIFLSNNFTNLKKIGKLKHSDLLFNVKVNRENKLTGLRWRFPSLKNFLMGLNEIPLCFEVIKILRRNDVSILHIPLYEDKDYFLLRGVSKMFGATKLVINIVDCQIPYYYFKPEPQYAYSSQRNYGRLFKNVKIDAIYTWYNEFKKFISANKIIASQPPVTVIRSRFTSAKLLDKAEFPNKRNVMVFAGRMDAQKNPLFFLKAISLVNSRTTLLKSWKVELYGKGELEKEVNEFISESNISSIANLSFTSDLPHVLKSSKCYVSAQEFENFPSLAMAEAMANGNAIIARNVGQTSYFVREGINGSLCKHDSPEGLAEVIIEFLKLDEAAVKKMGLESIKLLREEHNVSNFIKQTDEFWDTVDHAS